MTDDRDRRRDRDPLHPKPDSGKGRLAARAGECDSDDAWRNDPTPTQIPTPTVIVRASDYDVDVRWEQFDEMRRIVAECDRERIARTKRRKWIVGSVAGSGGTVIALLVWAVSKLDARAAANADERLRIQMIQRHEVEIRVLQDWRIRAETLLGLRAVPNP